jgi:Membrane carboxypeptidase/penicillin-binding protein
LGRLHGTRAFKKTDIDDFTLPDGISYVRINKKTGELSKSAEDESYFELFLSEDL